MATYSTDLTTYTTAEGGTWTEFSSANTGGSPSADGENYIQGTDCRSQTTGTKSGTANPKSVVFNNGSDISGSWVSGEAFFLWCFYAVGVNLYNYADTNPGHQVGIANDTSNVDRFKVGGADYGRNPYGGWFNAVVDPEQTADATYGTGGAGYQYVGSIVYTINPISKGTPHAVDAIRYGRGLLSVTGTGSSFSELAEYNDYNAGSTPPGTSSTSVDSGRHRLGLFQDSGGTYLWKGLLSFGITATSVTFNDSNETILIDDAAKTYAAFNKIEIHNASSSVTWTNITFTALGTTAPGDFEMVADATVALTACIFNDMGTFIFDSNATISGCTFNGCGLITANEADLSGSNFIAPTVAADDAAVLWNETLSASEIISELDNTTFEMGANNHHAITFGTGVDEDITLTGIEFTGFGSTDDANDSTVEFLATTGSLTLNLIDCTVGGATPVPTGGGKNFSVDDAAGIVVTVVVQPVTLTVTVKDKKTLAVIEGVQTSIHENDATFTELMNKDTNASGIATTSYSGATPQEIVWRCRKSDELDDPRYRAQSGIDSITSDGFAVTVLLEVNRVLIPPASEQAFEIIQSGSNSASGSATSITVSPTLTAGTGRKLLVWGGYAAGTDTTITATYDGNSMTSINNQAGSLTVEQELFWYDIPDGHSGSKDIVVTFGAARANRSVMFAIIGGAATGAEETETDSNAASGTSATSNMTSTSADTIFVQGVLTSSLASAFAATNGATEELEQAFGSFSNGHIVFEIRTASGADTIGASWTTSASHVKNSCVIAKA